MSEEPIEFLLVIMDMLSTYDIIALCISKEYYVLIGIINVVVCLI